ncbi:beta-hexosaminidase b, putative, partial [Perkinsus marinus ATCC 50983]
DMPKLLDSGFTIYDFPSFPHRGMLMDTGRRYLSVETIIKNLQLMFWTKMNVLHWHISDDVSFSLDLEGYEKLQYKNPTPLRIVSFCRKPLATWGASRTYIGDLG